ncbi:MAG TPA: O-antigen ligase family protein, partial [Thermodesulfobacteriota bacterium]|nr:O-antigen ligase family protein [Thermodesulfobacteriota bacterium]
WVALIWIMIIGSRSVSLWLGEGIAMEDLKSFEEGSPLDRNVFILLIIAGLLVLWTRRLSWSRMFGSNRWVFAFVLYGGISILWSDLPLVSFKRWTKELGNIVILLILLTEDNPAGALRAVFARYTYFAIPLSVVLIKYFPDYGRSYHRWTWETIYSGVAVEKNALGCIVLICGIFLVWDFMQTRKFGKMTMSEFCSRAALLLMGVWLMKKANSSTALFCLVLGSAVLWVMQRPSARRQARYLFLHALLAGFFAMMIYSLPGMFEDFVKILGRDSTLTGRTEIWASLLKEPVNALLGKGYQSFWVPAKRDAYLLNQAHNGYLEVYLNGGLLGVLTLLTLLLSATRNVKKEILEESPLGSLRLALLVIALFYNWTEAMFGGISLIWTGLLISALNHQPAEIPVAEEKYVLSPWVSTPVPEARGGQGKAGKGGGQWI